MNQRVMDRCHNLLTLYTFVISRVICAHHLSIYHGITKDAFSLAMCYEHEGFSQPKIVRSLEILPSEISHGFQTRDTDL